MPSYGNGRHEHGQNFLTDHRTIARVVDLVADTYGPILEIGPGSGALTLPLCSLGRPITGVEIDERLAAALRGRSAATIVRADFLRYRLPSTPHVIVGNLPFHRTTAILRRLLHSPQWTNSVLITQWEVARRRAAVGGASMMTAQWWPWFEFGLRARIPASAFRPSPGVDGGLLTIDRRADPLVPDGQRARYRDLVHAVFTGTGRGLERILARQLSRREVHRWLTDQRIRPAALPRDLDAGQWAALYDAVSRAGSPRSARPGTGPSTASRRSPAAGTGGSAR
ncbi:23S ribosomal RNA methyltransferase Erm [Pseudonocardiaceae bacterium YIM PH 21723]|nr:23S ribosomal RNA methyltransferase Erm [Pseudonocardiaceae bacterium YIM PH 21723]